MIILKWKIVKKVIHIIFFEENSIEVREFYLFHINVAYLQFIQIYNWNGVLSLCPILYFENSVALNWIFKRFIISQMCQTLIFLFTEMVPICKNERWGHTIRHYYGVKKNILCSWWFRLLLNSNFNHAGLYQKAASILNIDLCQGSATSLGARAMY